MLAHSCVEAGVELLQWTRESSPIVADGTFTICYAPVLDEVCVCLAGTLIFARPTGRVRVRWVGVDESVRWIQGCRSTMER